jgi:hypothetical protein
VVRQQIPCFGAEDAADSPDNAFLYLMIRKSGYPLNNKRQLYAAAFHKQKQRSGSGIMPPEP